MRELRQHASRYLARVAAGETVEITDRGRPVARLVPPAPDSWAEMIATGRIGVPDEDGDVLDERPVEAAWDVSGALRALRRDER